MKVQEVSSEKDKNVFTIETSSRNSEQGEMSGDTSESTSNSIGQGTNRYMAPEIKCSGKYNTKADVYSLAIVAQQIFELNKRYVSNY